MRYDRARVSLDRHATYIVAAFLAGAARGAAASRPLPAHERLIVEDVTDDEWKAFQEALAGS